MCRLEAILQAVTAAPASGLRLPRTLVVVAHADDEVLALGGRLSRHRESAFVHVTDGAPLDGADATLHGFDSLAQYREQRSNELRNAFRLAQIANVTHLQLPIADQRACLYLEYLSGFLERTIVHSGAEAVLTHPYEGGHPDHDACAFAVHSAARRLPLHARPVILEAAFYYAGPGGIETNRFLPAASAVAEVTRSLTPEEKSAKQALLDCFPTQRDTLQYFDTGVERYRVAPQYDFTRAPHPGELFYERFPWGATGASFRLRAALALAAEPAPCLGNRLINRRCHPEQSEGPRVLPATTKFLHFPEPRSER